MKKILIVDDEVEIVRALSMRLRSVGHEVIMANDGSMATTVAMRELPDLVILDIGLPCGDGHTVFERLRANLNTMLIPVIFLSARTSQVDKARAHDAGAFAYLTKPFRSDQLLDVVASAIGYAA